MADIIGGDSNTVIVSSDETLIIEENTTKGTITISTTS